MSERFVEAAAGGRADTNVAIEMIGVEKLYGKFQALRDINLRVMNGERIVICGPSGSGKSTLIRCINRLEEHDAGTILVEGVELTGDVRRIDLVRRDVGMVFQHFNLFPHMTILENCMLAPMQVRRHAAQGGASRRRWASSSACAFPSRPHKYPGQLSGGQQQRVAIARALCMQPQHDAVRRADVGARSRNDQEKCST